MKVVRLDLLISIWICCANCVLLKRRMVHIKCRGGNYPFSYVERLPVTDEQVPWSVDIPYNPPEYNSPVLLNKPWADPPLDDENFKPKWNALDGKINRQSHDGPYTVSNNDRRPLNPQGRTGITGRGILGKWGPNHAADPIVTRWKLQDDKKEYDDYTNLPILQFCAIQRRDCNQWALPGGMVDPGEIITETLLREFSEEALNSMEKKQSKNLKRKIRQFFSNGTEIYKGYVDDPRNTDNAWMETVAMNFHDETGKIIGNINLTAGDDAKNVTWMDITNNTVLYASHCEFIKIVARKHRAHW